MSCRVGKTILAQGPFCKVEGCACGTMHVSIGPLTVRLQPDVVESVWSTLGAALRFAGRADADEHTPNHSIPREHLS